MTTHPIGPSTRPVGDGYLAALVEDDAVELYESAPCGYLSTLPSGEIVKVNRTLLDWIGYEAIELCGARSIQDLLPVGDRIFYETHFAPALALQGHVREIAVELVGASGARLPVLLNAVQSELEDGTPGTVRIAVFDARERRAYEIELLESRRTAQQAAAAAQELAETLQRTLLPPRLPELPWLDLGGAYRPSGDGSVVGGDFYDVFQLADDTWGLVIGDVCGKGPEAAVVTALARYTIRAAAIRSDSPADVLGDLHDILDRDDSIGFVTAVYLVARRTESGVNVTFAVGGHPLPTIIRADGSLGHLGVGGSFLGMLGPPRLTDVDATLERGDALLLSTDGVIEARSDDSFFGEDRLAATISTTHGDRAQDVADAVANAAIDFQGGVTRDDIAVLVIAVPAA